MARDVRITKPDGNTYKERELEETLARVYSKDLFLASVDEEEETLVLKAVESFNEDGDRPSFNEN